MNQTERERLPALEEEARDDARAFRFPIGLLTVACLLTIVAFAGLGWIIFNARREAKALPERLSHIEELRGVIVHLDEVLTMSARMAATTGDSRWEERYHHFAPLLDAALKQTRTMGVNPSDIKAATEADAANIKLEEMEHRALALVRAGRKEEAQTVLFSPEYETLKQNYSEGIGSFANEIRRAIDEQVRDDRRIDLLSIIAAAVVGGVSFVAWLSVARVARRWRAQLLDSFHQRSAAEEHLRKAHAELETRVKDRTADLVTTNQALQVEVSERTRAEWQLNIQYAISRVLAESVTLKQASARVLQTVCENLNWHVGELWHVDRRTGVMQFDDVWTAPNTHADEFIMLGRQIAFAQGIGLLGRVWESSRPVWVADVTVEANFPRAAAAKKAGLHGAFGVPIVTGNEVVGAIAFFSHEIRQPDEELLRMFAVLGSKLGQFLERKRLEEQLIESQKMETVGKLAGAIAHEFNSILTTIIGQSELLLSDLPAGSPLAKSATAIGEAGGRAATLTRQLLAYGRKQMLQQQAFDLNQAIANMEGMFHHVVGGDVNTQIVLAPGLPRVNADATQIEQVIMDIVINAHEAMPNGGTLTIETAGMTFDERTVGRISELIPGDYVTLAITDTGAGMSNEVRARIFEPFFTTKSVGQGAGLGLSTSYGIVKQSGGHISAHSEPGRGTTFKIYLPQVAQLAEVSVQRLDSPDLPRGTETILLVEENPALREMAATLLRRLGYTVVAAANGIEALNLEQEHDIGSIDLLFTDVVMPHMSGTELSERVRTLYPHIRILFTSAHTENAIALQGMLNKGVALLRKPFTPGALAQKLRQVLDQPSAQKLDTVH